MTKSTMGQLSLFPELSKTDQKKTAISTDTCKTGDIRITLQLKTKGLEEWLKSRPKGTKFKVSLEDK